MNSDLPLNLNDSNKLTLQIRDLHVGYKVFDGLMHVLNGINLEVKKGEKIAIVGESGCGKTTTMRSILRVLPRSARIFSGEILYEGSDILKMRNKEISYLRQKCISMIFQDPTASLNPVFTIGQQLKDVIKISGLVKDKKNRKEKNKKAYELAITALQDCQLPDPERIMRNYPFQLSGGMRQRICIAMALSTARTMLIADEPTTNIDVTIQAQILELIDNMVSEREVSLLLITHSLGVAREVSDRIVVMYGGDIMESCISSRLFQNPLHPYTIGLLDAIPKLTGNKDMKEIPGKMVSYFDPPDGCRMAGRCSFTKDICRNFKPDLRMVEEGHYVACHII
ncbi:MAG: ABC transporter ATP-binding protein [Saccharofermentanales bacterium]|jgi:peptide/nickel transport system ATP-binding protein